MAVEADQGAIYGSMASTDSLLMKALKIYLQGLVIAVFGLLFYVGTPWLPLDYKVTGFILAFLAISYVLGIINSRVSKRFWAQGYRFSGLTVIGQGAVLMFICMIVLSGATTVVVIQVVGGPQVDPFFQIQLAFWTTLISPPFYGLLARDVASWKISPFE
jgi:hypothetical protein